MKNIIFDLGGVILKGEPKSVLNKIDASKEEKKELEKFFQDGEELDLGLISLEDQFNKCNYSNNIINKYKDILLNYYKLRDINYELIDLINKLKNNNYNIYILSDNSKEASNYYLNILKNIDGYILSCDYNSLKKDGLLFEKLIEKYNINPEDSYFIDNNIDNILVAKKYSFNSFLYDENKDIDFLIKDMEKYNINV